MEKLTPVQQKFILHWGEMGVRWGINRTMAQMHALLYLSPAPLNADDICEALGVARFNVSNSLRELQNWGIVKIVHVMGDRRDHSTDSRYFGDVPIADVVGRAAFCYAPIGRAGRVRG